MIYIPINQKRNHEFSASLMPLLVLRTRGAVHQSVNGLPSIWPSTFRPLWYTPFKQPPPSWPLHPMARSPLSLSFSHLLIPCLLSCFPTLAWMEKSNPPPPDSQQLNPFPCPAPIIECPKCHWHLWNCLCFRIFILLSCVCNYWNADREPGVGGSCCLPLL